MNKAKAAALPTHCLGIDVETRHARRLISRLRALKTTRAVHDGGPYLYCPGYSQVHLETVWTEQDLDDWLYRTGSDIEWVGTFTRAAAAA